MGLWLEILYCTETEVSYQLVNIDEAYQANNSSPCFFILEQPNSEMGYNMVTLDVLSYENIINKQLCPKNRKEEAISDTDEDDNTETEVPHQLVIINKASQATETAYYFPFEQPNFVEDLKQLDGIYNFEAMF